MYYVPVNTEEERKALRLQIERDTHPSRCRLFQDYDADDVILYGYYGDSTNEMVSLIEFGIRDRIKEEEIKAAKSIFESLKAFAKYTRYRGIADRYGKIIVPNIYTSIECIMYAKCLFKVSKNGKDGLLTLQGKEIIPPIYDKIFDAGEATLGFVENNLVGFMDVTGEIVIEPRFIYDPKEASYKFENGIVKIIERLPPNDELYYNYINHYGTYLNIFDFLHPIEEIYDNDDSWDEIQCQVGHSNRYSENFPDSSEAYEGDDSNRWNTD